MQQSSIMFACLLVCCVALMTVLDNISVGGLDVKPPFHERVALGLPSLAGYELFDAITKARELGFQSIMALPGGPKARHSLGEFPTLNFYDADEAYRQKLRSALAQFKHRTIHQAWDNNWRLWLECARFVRAEIVTIHAPSSEQVTEEFWMKQVKYFQAIGDTAQQLGIRIGLENAGGCYGDYIKLIQRIDHPAIGATIDVGHCAYFTEVRSITDIDERIRVLNDTIARAVRELGSKVYNLHVHNVRKSDWRDHRSVPDGVIDFPRLLRILSEVGYHGLFVIELEEPDKERKAVESGAYLTKLLSQH